jgi:predicted RNA polymerase sigma factor
MQDAFAAALARWPVQGLPDNPTAWITAVAHRKLIDYARRARTRRDKADKLLHETEGSRDADAPGADAADANVMSFPDDRLRLIFTCCHPALNPEAQELSRIQSSAVVALNHAVAVALSEGLETGLGMIDDLGSSGNLDSYYLFHAARADILRRLGCSGEAAEAYRRALGLTANAVERRYLRRRLHELTTAT